MIRLQENVDLSRLHTFGIRVRGRWFARFGTEQELRDLLGDARFQHHRLILGGGSNVVFLRNYEGLILQVGLQGREIREENDEHVWLRVQAGESWHALVEYCLAQNWGGIENLALIPGTVGAAPIQNIGAYGVELAEVVEEVAGIDLTNGQSHSFQRHECRFGYRESIFKQEWKEKFFISSVTLRLTRKKHILRTQYGSLEERLREKKISSPTIQDIARCVMEIRKSKLPDPAVVGNAGSFFKNPEVTPAEFGVLREKHRGIPHYLTENQLVKIPAAWLIEHCGWKGKRVGGCAVHTQQALVLINAEDATGDDVLSLVRQIRMSVRDAFGIHLVPEVNLIEGEVSAREL